MPLYHDELELVAARFSGPDLLWITLWGRGFDSRAPADVGMIDPSFSVTFRNPGSELELPFIFSQHHCA